MDTPTLNERGKLMLAIIQGYDRPGTTASLMGVFAEHDAYIPDIDQSDTHSHLNLGILFRTSEDDLGSVLEDLFFKGCELNVQVHFTLVFTDEYGEWVNTQGKDRYIITVVTRKMTTGMPLAVAGAAAERGLNIDNIRHLTGRILLDRAQQAPTVSIEFSMRSDIKDVHTFQLDLLQISGEPDMGISFQKESMFRRMRHLIHFDVGSTLIQTEMIDELAMGAGVGDQVKAITERAMHGEIGFIESFTKRVALLKGLGVSVMEDVVYNLPITEGCERFMRTLKVMGYKTATLSSGFTYFGRYLQKKFNIDYVYTNELGVAGGKFTGRYVGSVVDGCRKADLLRLIAQIECVDLLQTVTVGDGANDLLVLSLVELGIAFHAKLKVKVSVEQHVSSVDLDGVLYFLNYKDSLSDEQMIECIKDGICSTLFPHH